MEVWTLLVDEEKKKHQISEKNLCSLEMTSRRHLEIFLKVYYAQVTNILYWASKKIYCLQLFGFRDVSFSLAI